MANLVEKLEDHQAAQAEVRTSQKRATNIMRDIQKRIRKGETTGNPAKDLVIGLYGDESEQLESIYARLLASIQSHQNELVLVVSRSKESIIHDAPPSREMYRVETRLELGVLQGTSFLTDWTASPFATCAFPTGAKYVSYIDRALSDKIDLVGENLGIAGNILTLGLACNIALGNLDTPLDLDESVEFSPSPNPVMGMEIVIGTQEVTEWFAKTHPYDSSLLERMCQRPGFQTGRIRHQQRGRFLTSSVGVEDP